MLLDTRDFGAILVVSLTFFLVASWELGAAEVPLSVWRSTGREDFLLMLEDYSDVGAIYVLIKQGTFRVTIYSDHPDGWNEEKTISMQGYYRWEEIDLDCQTQFVRFFFEQSYGEIAEIVVLDGESRKVKIRAIEGAGSEELLTLVDEQEEAKVPPTYFSETFFDEIYYVRAAEDYLNHREPYEWTHPPLGKLIIAVGIWVFGYSPFGWRIVGVLFATMMVPVIYLLGKSMFGTWMGGFAPAFLLTFDFMHFTMGRISTVDTFAIFFSLTSHLFFFIYFQRALKEGFKASFRPLLFAVLFFALGFSTKWYVLYGFAGQGAILVTLTLKSLLSSRGESIARVKSFLGYRLLTVIGFVLIAAAIYCLTFVPYVMIGHTLKEVYERQWTMFTYHSTLTASHPFSSQWWSWPLMLRPVWLYVSDLEGGLVSTIAAFGNPGVWWVGFGSIILLVGKAIKSRDGISSFVVTVFLFQWLPYALITRCTFLYHFYINVPFLCLAITCFLVEAGTRRRDRLVCSAYLLGVTVLFTSFYPVISGYPVPSWWRECLRWLNSWGF